MAFLNIALDWPCDCQHNSCYYSFGPTTRFSLYQVHCVITAELRVNPRLRFLGVTDVTVLSTGNNSQSVNWPPRSLSRLMENLLGHRSRPGSGANPRAATGALLCDCATGSQPHKLKFGWTCESTKMIMAQKYKQHCSEFFSFLKFDPNTDVTQFVSLCDPVCVSLSAPHTDVHHSLGEELQRRQTRRGHGASIWPTIISFKQRSYRQGNNTDHMCNNRDSPVRYSSQHLQYLLLFPCSKIWSSNVQTLLRCRGRMSDEIMVLIIVYPPAQRVSV